MHKLIFILKPSQIDIGEEEMGVDEYGEEIVRSYSGAEDKDVEIEQLSGEDLDEYDDNDDNIVCEQSPGDPEGMMYDDQGDSSDGWLASGDGQEMWGDHDGSSLGLETPDGPPKDSSKDCRITNKDSQCRPESVPHVKTSAKMGVGLQELLELIDERLKTQKVVQRSPFDRKWRPPRADETGIAVEQ